MADPMSCAQHPAVETRLRCSACETAICPDCAREAAVGYKCPPCARHSDATTSRRMTARGRAFSFGGGPDRRTPSPRGDGRLEVTTGARATVVGLAAALAGGLVLAPVLAGGFLFLLSAGAIGWAVARAVYWGSQGTDAPYLRAIALTFAGFTVAIALAVAGLGTAPAGVLFLAYPAAVYGGWIVVRSR